MDIALKKKNVYNPVEVMNMSKEVKTNAMRMLDKHHIRYDMIQYECDEFIDGLHTAEKTGAPVEQSFKTLMAQGKSKRPEFTGRLRVLHRLNTDTFMRQCGL